MPRTKWTRGDFRVSDVHEKSGLIVNGFTSGPFGVHKGFISEQWFLTQLSTGLKFPNGFKTKAKAISMAELLLAEAGEEVWAAGKFGVVPTQRTKWFVAAKSAFFKVAKMRIA